VKALKLPKTESASHVRLLAELVEKIERQRGMAVGHTRLMPAIETARDFFRAEEIAAAHPRNISLTLGSEDFTASIGAVPDAEVMTYPKQHALIAARAAGLRAFGVIGSGADYRDEAAFRDLIKRSRKFGIQGSTCIHPALVPLLNEGFSPTAQEIAHARRIVDAYRSAVAENRGSFSVDGKMIDIPIVERAEELLSIASRFSVPG
jgi:citrate lyase subunit beta/citryl-CoA lyase